MGASGEVTRYRVFRRNWRNKKAVFFSMLFELAGIVPMLVLFGIAQPDLYRTTLWTIGFANGFNSNPNMILYAYANHVALPTVPFVWSQTLTNYNVAISVLSLFMLLSKLIAFIMKVYYPIAATIANFAMVALYCASIAGQAGPDYADSRYPSPSAWYLRIGCYPAKAWNAYSSCQLAQGTFACTVYLLTVYVFALGLSIYSMLPNPDAYTTGEEEEEADEERAGSAGNDGAEYSGDKFYEMTPATPASPRAMAASPFTPRSQAFHSLDRKLPLRVVTAVPPRGANMERGESSGGGPSS